jgi:HD-GYP domain-containing protein (c-di-GMP phosphodiesterase class II)
MRRIIIKEARPGMIAARSLEAPPIAGTAPQSPVITGEILSLEHLARIHELGIYDLWVTDPGLEFFDEICATQPTVPQRRLAEGLRDSFYRLSASAPRTFFRRFDLTLAEIFHGVLRAAPTVPCFAALTEDEALLMHSCDVAALSVLLGLQLETYLVEQRRRLSGRHARDIVNLALGALFHDVGELLLPVQHRESRLSPQSLESSAGWKQHTDEGYAIVRGKLDPSAAAVVLHHHQRFDGGGFGSAAQDEMHRSMRGSAIHVYARIVMAADLFCQSLYPGNSRLPQPLVKTLWEIQQMPLRNAFDSIVHQCLASAFPPFAEGSVVTLSDRRQALVTRVDPAYPCYPEVQPFHTAESMLDNPYDPTRIKLAERTDLAIQSMDGTSVESFLYGIRKVHPLVAA